MALYTLLAKTAFSKLHHGNSDICKWCHHWKILS